SPVYPSTVLETAEGYVGVTALTWQQWTGLCNLIGRPEVAHIPHYATSAQRILYADEIDEILIPIFKQQPTAHWVAGGDAGPIPITPAPLPRDLPALPHWRDRGSFAAIAAAPALGPTLPFHFGFDGVKRPRPNGGARGPLSGIVVADFT